MAKFIPLYPKSRLYSTNKLSRSMMTTDMNICMKKYAKKGDKKKSICCLPCFLTRASDDSNLTMERSGVSSIDLNLKMRPACNNISCSSG